MSKGNPIVKLRVTQTTIDKIVEAIQSANFNRKLSPYDLSSWIRAAIDEKLQHLERAKRRKKPLQTAVCKDSTITPTEPQEDHNASAIQSSN